MPGEIFSASFFGASCQFTHTWAQKQSSHHARTVGVLSGKYRYLDIDIFKARIALTSIRAEFSPALLGGVWLLRGITKNGEDFSMIPYHLWAKRGESQMAVWTNALGFCLLFLAAKLIPDRS